MPPVHPENDRTFFTWTICEILSQDRPALERLRATIPRDACGHHDARAIFAAGDAFRQQILTALDGATPDVPGRVARTLLTAILPWVDWQEVGRHLLGLPGRTWTPQEILEREA